MAKKSITETGPKPLRGIRNSDLYPEKLNISDEQRAQIQSDYNNARYRNYSVSQGHVGYEALRDPALYSPQRDPNGTYGESMFDEGLMVNLTPGAQQDLRAENQPGIVQIGAGIAKGLTTAATTFLDNTLGIATGIITAAYKGRFSGLYDNEFTRAMKSFNDMMEEALPNYYSEDEQEHPFRHFMNANFIGDKLIKNLGFVVGTIYSGGLTSKLVTGVGTALAKGARTGFGLAKSATALKNSAKLTQGIIKTTKAVSSPLATFQGAVGEASLEALSAKQEFEEEQYKALNKELEEKSALLKNAYNSGVISEYDYMDGLNRLSKYKDNTQKEIQDKALNAGNLTFALNMPMVWGANALWLGKLFAKGFGTAKKMGRSSNKHVAGSYKDWLGKGADGTKPYSVTGYGAKNMAWQLSKGRLAEGGQEWGQAVASDVSKMYYGDVVTDYKRSALNPKANEDNADFTKSLGQALYKNIESESSWEEFLLGSLTSVLGAPKFRSMHDSNGKLRSPITMEGSLFSDIKQYNKDKEATIKAVERANKRVMTDEFKKYWTAMSRHRALEKDKDDAVENDDQFAFENANRKQMHSDIALFHSLGRLEDLKEFVKEASTDLTDDAIDTLISESTSVIKGAYSVEELTNQRNKIDSLVNRHNGLVGALNEIDSRLDEDDNNIGLINARKAYYDEIQELKETIETEKVVLDNMSTSERDIYISPFLDENGNVLYTYKKMREIVKKNGERVLNAIEDYTTERDIIDTVFEGRLSDEGLEAVTHLSLMANESLQRIREMANEVYRGDTLANYIKTYIDWLSNTLKEGTTLSEEEKETLNKTIETLLPFIGLKNISELDKDAASKLNVAYIKSAFSNKNHVEGNSKIIADILKSLELNNSPIFSNDVIDFITKSFTDIGKLSNQYNELSNVLREYRKNPDKVEEDLNKADQEILEEHENSVREQVRERVSNISSREDLANAREEYSDESRIFNEEFENAVTEDPRLEEIHRAEQREEERLKRVSRELEGESKEDGINLSDMEKVLSAASIIDDELSNGATADRAKLKAREALLRDANEELTEEQERKIQSIVDRAFALTNTVRTDEERVEGIRNPELSDEDRVEGEEPEVSEEESGPRVEAEPEEEESKSIEKRLEEARQEAVLGNIREESRSFRRERIDSSIVTEPIEARNSVYFRATRELGKDIYNPAKFNEWVDKQSYSPAHKIKIKKVHEYLTEMGAFDYINSGKLSVNTKVSVVIDPTLNAQIKEALEQIGETEEVVVLLLVDTNTGQVLSDLPSSMEGEMLDSALNLRNLYNKSIELFNNRTEKNNEIFYTPYTTHVNKLYIGTPAYSEHEHTVSSIFNGTGAEIKLAVEKSQGEIVTDSSIDSNSILKPLSIKYGSVDVLIRTGNPEGTPRSYYPVRAYMTKYDKEDNSSEGMNPIIEKTLRSIAEAIKSSDEKKIVEGLLKLLDFLYTPDFHIDVNNGIYKIRNGKTKISGKIEETDINSLVSAMKGLIDGSWFNVKTYLLGTKVDGKNYEDRISHHIITDLQPGKVTTIDNWFSVNPFDSEMNEIESRGFRSTRTNPNPRRSTNTMTVELDRVQYKVDIDTNRVEGGSSLSRDLKERIAAEAWIAKTHGDALEGANMFNGVALCPNGKWYDRKTHKFVSDPRNPSERTTSTETPEITPEETESETPSIPDDNAEGITDDDVRAINDDTEGSTPTGDSFAGLLGLEESPVMPSSDSILDRAEAEFDDDALFRKAEEENTGGYTQLDESVETEWLNKALPNLSSSEKVRVVRGLLRTPSGRAYGAFVDSVIYISDVAARGTVFHEAFHSVMNTLMTADERREAFELAKKKWGKTNLLELEELMAEDFREYMESIKYANRFQKFFRSLANIVKTLAGRRNTLDSLYYRINRGKFGNRTQYNRSNNNVRYKLTDDRPTSIDIKDIDLSTSDEQLLRKDLESFFKEFDITLKDLGNWQSNEPIFNALDRVIEYRDIESLTENAGYAIAFMMQYHSTVSNLIGSTAFKSALSAKGARRGLRKTGSFRTDIIEHNSSTYKENLKLLGKDIAKELRKIYLGESSTVSVDNNEFHNIIKEFYNLITVPFLSKYRVISSFTRNVVNSVKMGDATIIKYSDTKPGSSEPTKRVDISKALKENKYEDSIIKTLQKYNIALAGSASIAVDNYLLRPIENPLHDIDFSAEGKTKEELQSILKSHFKNVEHTNTIAASDHHTETFIILDRPFTLGAKDKDGRSVIFDKSSGEELGTVLFSDLKLKDGIQGKMLDFFTHKSQFLSRYVSINNHVYLISDAREAMNAKITWARAKDIWDFVNFRSLDADIDDNTEIVRDRIRTAKIIWGHPAIGKTTYLENKNDIIDWDEEFNDAKNQFIKDSIDPEGKLTKKEFSKVKKEFLINWRNNESYIKFLNDNWQKLKEKASRENKKIFASSAPFLEIFKDDFDLFINVPRKTFISRNMDRKFGDLYSSIDWKNSLDESLVKVNPDLIVTTDKYLSDLMDDVFNNSESRIERDNAAIEQYHREKLRYDNLSAEERDYVNSLFSKEEWNSLPDEIKEAKLQCR